MNRFDKATPLNLVNRHYAIDSVYTPNMEMWSKVLEKQQGKYDQAQSMGLLKPEYAHFDREKADEWVNKNKQEVEKISNIYASGKDNAIELGNRALNEYSLRTRQDVSTGDYAKLKMRKAAHEEAMKSIEANTKDDPALARDYALNLYNSSIKPGDLNQNLVAPSIGKYQDLEKQWREAKAAMDAGKVTEIQIGDKWIKTTEKEGWSEDRKKEVFDAIMNDQKNKFTVDANAWSKARNIDPDKYASYLNEKAAKSVDAYDKRISVIEQAVKKGDKKEIAALQKVLKGEGIDVGTIDGVAGEKTIQGIQLLKDKLEAAKKQLVEKPYSKDNININEIMKNQFISEQQDYFNSLFGYTSKEKVEANPYGLAATKAAYAKQQADYEHQLRLREQFLPAPNEGLAMPDTPIQENRMVSNAKAVAENAIKDLNGQIQSGMKDMAKAIGLPPNMAFNEETYKTLMDIKKQSTNPQTGKVDANIMKQKLEQQGSWWSQTFNPNVIAETFNNPTTKEKVELRDNIERANDAFESRKIHQFTVEQANGIWNSAADAAMKDGTTLEAWKAEYKLHGLRGESLDDFMKNVMSNQGTVNAKDRFFRAEWVGGKETSTIQPHNKAVEILNRVNQKTNNKMSDIISKTSPTYRYTQNDKQMPLGDLTEKVNFDIQAGLFKSYGMAGEDGLKWKDANGKDAKISDPTSITDVKTSIINTPSGPMFAITTQVKDGKETKLLKSYSDIRDEVKPTVTKSLKAEAFSIANSNPSLAAELMQSARMLEDGASSMPNYNHRNSTINSSNRQIEVGNQGYHVTDNFSNDYIDKPTRVGNFTFGLKRVGFGDSKRTAIIAEGIDPTTGKKTEMIVKLKNGKISSGGTFYAENENDALKELNLFKLLSDDDIKQEVETNRRKAGSTSTRTSINYSTTTTNTNEE